MASQKELIKTTCPRDCYDRCGIVVIKRDGAITKEEALTLDDLRSADEAFLTNANAGVMPLVSVDGGKIGDGRPGPLTRRIRELYERDATG